MPGEVLKDRGEIESFLRQDSALHVYALGDLDDFFFPHVEWIGWREGGALQALFLIYRGTELPVLMALDEADHEASARLYRWLLPKLPQRLYSHLSPHLVGTPGTHLKMRLKPDASLPVRKVEGIELSLLTKSDAVATAAFYSAAYPQNWFDPRMLDTGGYVGAKKDGRLVAIAGVHVFSPKYRVAAVGNIATMPSVRNQGLASAVTTELCRLVRKSVDLIGLNVKADNAAAIKCYERLGFETVARFHEILTE